MLADEIEQSQYKSLLISERTTTDDVIELLLGCHNNNERIERFAIHEVCNIPGYEYERKLHPDDLPLSVQSAWKTWNADGGGCGRGDGASTNNSFFSFVLKRNADTTTSLARRRVSQFA